MKTKFRFIKRLLNMAAIVLVGAMMSISCADGNDFTDEPPQPKIETNHTVTLTTTISLGSSSVTRALDASGQKTFAAGDLVAVIYKDIYDQTQKAVSTALVGIGTDISDDGKTATISVTLSDPAANGQLRLIYPAAMAKASIATDADIDDDSTIDFDALATQDGTLASLAASLDLTTYDGHLTATATLPSNPKLSNRLAIGEFTIMDTDGSNNLTSSITELIVDDGINTYTMTPAAPATGFGDGPIYVAMKPVKDDKTIHFLAATETVTAYVKNVMGKSLEAGSMYPVNLRTTSAKNLARTGSYKAQDGDVLTGKPSADSEITIANSAKVTLNGVNICATGNAGITCYGSVTIDLAEGSTNTVMTSSKKYAGIQVGSGELIISASGSGSGSLTASGGEGGAGIGNGEAFNTYINCGNITITGGNMTANGGKYAAGIGSGYSRSRTKKTQNNCGDITISGGTVTAKAGTGAAGIGTGYSLGEQEEVAYGKCGHITISGCSITVYGGGGYQICIGKGRTSKKGQNSAGPIKIGGKSITAVDSPYHWSKN